MKKYIVILGLGIIATLFACEKSEKIEDFPLYPPKLVVNSYLHADSTLSIHLSKSLSVLDNAELKNVDDASIDLYEDNSYLATLNTSDGDGNYLYNHILKPGSEYSIEAKSTKLGTAKANTMVPKKVTIKEYEISTFDNDDWGKEYKFSITFDDLPELGDYYMLGIAVIKVDSFIAGTDTIVEEYHSSNVYLSSSSNPASDEIVGGTIFFKDEFFNGKTYTIDVNAAYVDDYAYKLKLIAELYTLSEANYKYRKSLAKFYDSSGNPFAEPVQVFNNIEGGYGIFGGQNVHRDTITIAGNNYWFKK
jgi:hypothetical protein